MQQGTGYMTSPTMVHAACMSNMGAGRHVQDGKCRYALTAWSFLHLAIKLIDRGGALAKPQSGARTKANNSHTV